MTLAAWLLNKYAGVTSLTTIADLYELPHGMPAPHLPAIQLQEGQTLLMLVQDLFPAAFTIAMLGAIESLLSAMVADGVIGDQHNSNTELIAQGVANVVVPFFGGIPATGAIARTAANVRSGGRTPVAGMVHALVLVLVLMMKAMPDYIRVNKEHEVQQAKKAADGTSEKMSYFALFLILFYIFMRSSIHSGISTYLPLYFMKFRGFEAVFSSSLVSGFLLGGVAGTYVGSVLSDRLGARKILLGSITLSIPAIYCITIATTQAFAMVSVVLAGFFIIGSFATTIIIAQCMMPNNVGMASGLTIGFSVGLGGFGVTILGMLADRFGLPTVMQLLVWLPIIAAVTAIWIPIPKKLQK